MSDLVNKIHNSLLEELHINFDVSKSNENIIITEDNITHSSFFLLIEINEVKRLTITCEPDIHGKAFVDTLNKSTKEQKQNFIYYWEKLNQIHCKLEISINGALVKQEQFLNYSDRWDKIKIRFTKAPFYNIETENFETKLIDYIQLVCLMILSLCEIEYKGEEEGNEIISVSKRYERNPINRKICLLLKGYSCAVCGFNFEKTYGSIGKNYIQVHHLIPVSSMGVNYQVDPSKDLIPLCSNCHSMVHRKSPPYTPDEIKGFIFNNKKDL